MAGYPRRALLLAGAVASLAIGVGHGGRWLFSRGDWARRLAISALRIWLYGSAGVAETRLWSQFRATLDAHHDLCSSLFHHQRCRIVVAQLGGAGSRDRAFRAPHGWRGLRSGLCAAHHAPGCACRRRERRPQRRQRLRRLWREAHSLLQLAHRLGGFVPWPAMRARVPGVW